MGRKDASATKLPVDQYRKQIGKQDYKKTKSVLKATRLKAEAKKNSSGFRLAAKGVLLCSLLQHLHAFFSSSSSPSPLVGCICPPSAEPTCRRGTRRRQLPGQPVWRLGC
ncbi:triple QxxK/R motif-containing protein isoform X2 [Dunckerocampus dactyliophorus]|uniref:triple QxxK/R motif-containing protein isoform X2 n=1 Tax=Dunckerocampus dactyliophorus TaxID=161453 RepID=UPI0024058DB9|nr:triple QxxK/R motif-containing protein isoform X2 [Dunckerocampus dactyliophorus]